MISISPRNMLARMSPMLPIGKPFFALSLMARLYVWWTLSTCKNTLGYPTKENAFFSVELDPEDGITPNLETDHTSRKKGKDEKNTEKNIRRHS